MKLIYRIMMRLSLCIVVVLGVWSAIFYYAMVDEVNDETDDVLEDYSTLIIQGFLAGEEMPATDNGSNNTYYMRPISRHALEQAREQEGFSYEQIYLKYKNEYEPARVLRRIFRDADDNHYEVVVTTPTIDRNDLIDAIWELLVMLFVTLLLVVLGVSAFAIRGGLSPLRKFLLWLNTSNIESPSVILEVDSTISEIKALQEAIAGFAARGRRAFEEQKEFLGNASHELQTPIAICQNRLELLCESNLTEQQLMDVAECLSTLSRLAKLNKSLLLLSRIENGEFERQEVNVSSLAKRHASLLEEIYQDKEIHLSIAEEGTCLIEANRELATTLVVNLIKNGFAHNVAGGEVRVIVTPTCFAVENSSDGKSLEADKIFARFYQGTSRSGTSGLGLSIVFSICKLYGFEVQYRFVENRHRFEINFC